MTVRPTQDFLAAQGANLTKGPFDPLAAGWVACDSCNGSPVGVLGDACDWCDGLGIVIGKATDGKHLAAFLDARAHYHPDLRPIFTQEYWRDRD